MLLAQVQEQLGPRYICTRPKGSSLMVRVITPSQGLDGSLIEVYVTSRPDEGKLLATDLGETNRELYLRGRPPITEAENVQVWLGTLISIAPIEDCRKGVETLEATIIDILTALKGDDSRQIKQV